MINLLSSLVTGRKPSPRAAMNFINDEIEKKIGPNEGFCMSVDFTAETIDFEIPERKIKERLDNSIMFAMIRGFMSSEVKSDAQIVALIVDYKKSKPFECRYYYTLEGKNLFDTKTIQ